MTNATQLPVWEQTINGMDFTETTKTELIDFIDGHAADAEMSPEEYVSSNFDGEAEMSLEGAPDEDTFGFTMDDVMKVQEAFSNWYTNN